MSNAKSCIRCGRAIDQWATLCPYCNWDQHATPPAPGEVQQPSPAASYVPPEEAGLKKKIFMIAAGAMLLVASFAVGMVINRDGAPKRAPETLEEQAAEHNAELAVGKPRRANTALVPAGAGGIEQPITSAPAAQTSTSPNGATSEYERTDATAVSSVEYSQLAKRDKAEKERMASIVDPRSLTGPAYAQAPRRPAPISRPSTPAPQQQTADASPQVEAPRRMSIRTRPVATSQPLPSIRAHGTARLTLMIGADGDVQSVSVERPLAGGNTAALVAAVQRWRFKPATENGEPVAAPYSVEINFK